MTYRYTQAELSPIAARMDVTASYHGGAICGQTVYPDGTIICWDETADGPHELPAAIEAERYAAAAEWLARQDSGHAEIVAIHIVGGEWTVEVAA